MLQLYCYTETSLPQRILVPSVNCIHCPSCFFRIFHFSQTIYECFDHPKHFTIAAEDLRAETYIHIYIYMRWVVAPHIPHIWQGRNPGF